MIEQTFYSKKHGKLRPFSLSAGVGNRQCSLPLERILTDFGADHAFNQVHKKLKEHYGIKVPNSLPRSATLKHSREIEKNQLELTKKTSPKSCVISETDGCMIPIVETDSKLSDSRKQKKLKYREARLTLAHEKGSVTPFFSGTLKDVKTAGKHIAHCVTKVGVDSNTQIHCVGDGATWIADQIEELFGDQANYLVDFYHVCEYLAAASVMCAKQNPVAWVEAQKKALKKGEAKQVINELKLHLEPCDVKDESAPVRACHRYLVNRISQLNYKAALDNNLPIGSGEIESAHGYVIQKRLKIAGGWWLESNAETMLALRTQRANNEWERYWENL